MATLRYAWNLSYELITPNGQILITVGRDDVEEDPNSTYCDRLFNSWQAVEFKFAVSTSLRIEFNTMFLYM